MGTITDAINSAWRDYVTAGVAATGPNEPAKSEIRAIGPLIESAIATAGLGALVDVVKDTRANLNADLAHAADTVALVYGDATDSNNDLYVKVGASDSGSWTNTGALRSVVESIIGDTASLVASVNTRNVQLGDPAGSGTEVANANYYYDPNSLSDSDEYISVLRTSGGADRVLDLVIAAVAGDGTLSLVSRQPVSFGPGASETEVSVFKPAGCVYGLSKQSGSWYYTPGGTLTIWDTAGLPTTGTVKSVTSSNGPNMGAEIRGVVAHGAAVGLEQSTDALDAVGEAFAAGFALPMVSTGTTVPSGYGIIFPDVDTSAGVITSLDIGMGSAGTANVIVAKMTGNVITDLYSVTPLSLGAGVSSVALAIEKPEGYTVGIQGAGYRFQAFTNPEFIRAWTKSGAFVEGETLAAPSAEHRYECRLTVETGLVARVTLLENSGTGDGTSELSETANTGAGDVSAELLSARSSHPFPYARPGTFASSTLPYAGEGFNGPGVISVNGEPFILPETPRLGNLHDAARAALMEHIAAGNPLVLCSDSRGHFAYAANGPDHWFNRLCRFLNFGVAADEPVMTALRPSATYTPAFYGVSVFGGSTTTDGPIVEALQIADGGYIEFVGTYEQVDVFAKQQAGAGTLSVSFNGAAAYGTKAYAGATALDVHSGFPATGQTGSGTYRIAASGGPVVITGLIREGILTTRTAVGKQRLRCIRAAHGSYLFGSFTAAAITSQMAQAAHWGGQGVPIIDLGINDAFTLTPAAIATNAGTMIDRYEAAGAPEIFAIIPGRPSSGWNASYGAGRYYETAIGALRKVYRERGVRVIGVDDIAWRDTAGFSDGLHYGPGEPQLRKMRAVVSGILKSKGA